MFVNVITILLTYLNRNLLMNKKMIKFHKLYTISNYNITFFYISPQNYAANVCLVQTILKAKLLNLSLIG